MSLFRHRPTNEAQGGGINWVNVAIALALVALLAYAIFHGVKGPR